MPAMALPRRVGGLEDCRQRLFAPAGSRPGCAKPPSVARMLVYQRLQPPLSPAKNLTTVGLQ